MPRAGVGWGRVPSGLLDWSSMCLSPPSMGKGLQQEAALTGFLEAVFCGDSVSSVPFPFVLTMPPCSTDVRGAHTLLYPGGGALVEVGPGISLAAFLTGRNICTEHWGLLFLLSGTLLPWAVSSPPSTLSPPTPWLCSFSLLRSFPGTEWVFINCLHTCF